VRLFNPTDCALKGKLRLNGGLRAPASQSPVKRVQAAFALPAGKGKRFSQVRAVSLEEVPQSNLRMNADGWVPFEIAKKKILTIEFRQS
jgi:hypothetical protein